MYDFNHDTRNVFRSPWYWLLLVLVTAISALFL